MVDCIDATVWPDENIVADCHLRFVKYGQIEIGHKVLADGDMFPKIAMEWRMDGEGFVYFAEKSFDDICPFGLAARRQRVNLKAKFFCVKQ